MGHLITRFRKEEVEDVLDRLEVNIKKIRRDIRRQQYTYMRVRKYMMYLVLLFMTAYFIYIIFNWATLPSLEWSQILLFTLPPIIILILYKIIIATMFYYNRWLLQMNITKQNKMREEKQRRLEEVKNTAVYSAGERLTFECEKTKVMVFEREETRTNARIMGDADDVVLQQEAKILLDRYDMPEEEMEPLIDGEYAS